MFFNNYGKEISSKIKSHGQFILNDFYSFHFNAVNNTRTEIQYFRHFFPALETYLNGVNISGLSFTCRTKEIHGSPIVTYGVGKSCELGDYIIVVKYKKTGQLVGRKIIIYQLKRSHNSFWSINQKQLNLLKDWPTFNFGRRQNAANSFTLRPNRPEYGSFVLVNDLKFGRVESNVFGTAYDVFQNQANKRVRVADRIKFYYPGIISYFNLLIWEIGEPIVANTDIADFTSALYRFLDWEEDPSDEFLKYQKTGDNNSFWGIEITVNSEG